MHDIATYVKMVVNAWLMQGEMDIDVLDGLRPVWRASKAELKT